MHDIGAGQVGLSDQLFALGVPGDDAGCVSSGCLYLELMKVGEDVCCRYVELFFEDGEDHMLEGILVSKEQNLVCVLSVKFFPECLCDTQLKGEDLLVGTGDVLVGSFQFVCNPFGSEEVLDGVGLKMNDFDKALLCQALDNQIDRTEREAYLLREFSLGGILI